MAHWRDCQRWSFDSPAACGGSGDLLDQSAYGAAHGVTQELTPATTSGHEATGFAPLLFLTIRFRCSEASRDSRCAQQRSAIRAGRLVKCFVTWRVIDKLR